MEKRITPDHVYRDLLRTIEVLLMARRGWRDPHNEPEQLLSMMNEISAMRKRDEERDERQTFARLKAKYEPTDPEAEKL